MSNADKKTDEFSKVRNRQFLIWSGTIMDISGIKPDSVLDCVGQACPLPIYKTSIRIKEMIAGQVLEVQSDDDGIEKDMPAWCKLTGNEYLGLVKENGEYHVYVRKTQAP